MNHFLLIILRVDINNVLINTKSNVIYVTTQDL